MSILWRTEPHLPLLELVKAWARELAVIEQHLLDALMDDMLADRFDRVDGGSPGVYLEGFYRDPSDREALTGEGLRCSLENQLESKFGQSTIDIERQELASVLRISRAAALELAARRGISPPSWWAAEPTAEPAPAPAGPDRATAERLMKEFIERQKSRGKTAGAIYSANLRGTTASPRRGLTS